VLAKDVPGQLVTVSHEDIPGFMPAMTMNYPTKDPHGIHEVEPGDMITADVIVKSNRDFWLENVRITDRSKRGTISVTKPHALLSGERVPDVPLVTQDGKTLHLWNFKGKAVLLTFIYTRCPFPTFYPLISSKFAAVHNTLAQAPLFYEQTHMVSVSLDPSYDTAPVLRKYGLAYLKGNVSGFSQRDFVSTSPANLQQLATAFGLVYYAEGNQISHTMNTILLAPDGTVKQMWPGSEWKTSEVVAALKDAASLNN
jgi:protein SCO1/2